MTQSRTPLVVPASRAPVEGTGTAAFTLIEMSIVLVIIGLIVGGVLVGQDLIRAAGVRATITQIEKYNAAVNTFRGKYGYLPGDIRDPDASSFGFAARGQYAGEGDGNGVIEGAVTNASGQNYGWAEGFGETVMFWADLSKAFLVEAGFTAASSTTAPGSDLSGGALGAYLPQAKLGGGNFVYVYSLGTPSGSPGINYFGVSAISLIGANVNACNWCIASTPGLTEQQAYSIDKKVDDGLPQSGNVTAGYLDALIVGWRAVRPAAGGVEGASGTAATSGASTTCYDNGNVNGATQQYSLSQNGGAGVNCALSFRFQ